MQLARRIRAFRKLKGFTQQNLADQSGISLAMLGMFERGTRKPTDKQLAVIAEALEITIAELQR